MKNMEGSRKLMGANFVLTRSFSPSCSFVPWHAYSLHSLYKTSHSCVLDQYFFEKLFIVRNTAAWTKALYR